MCLNPILIKNPYYGLTPCSLNKFHDCTSTHIPIPCGNCSVCVRLRQSYLVQRCQMETLSNHLFFCTLTYNETMIPRLKLGDYVLQYPDFTHVQKMFKRIRKSYDLLPFKYLVVSEYGGLRHRPHFHMIISYPKYSNGYLDILNLERRLHDIFLKEWRVNLGSTRSPRYVPLCTYVNTRKGRTFDLHYINPRASSSGEEDVAFYVTKYCLKYSDYVDRLKTALIYNYPDEFKDLWLKLRPRANISKGFGSPYDPKVIDYIKKCLSYSVSDSSLSFPVYINPFSGQTFPLSPYYRRKFMTIDDMEVFFQRNPNRDTIEDNYLEIDYKDPREVIAKEIIVNDIRRSVRLREQNESFINEDTNNTIKEFSFQALEVPDNPRPQSFDDFDGSDFLSEV